MKDMKTILLVFGGSVLLVVLMAIGLSKVSGGGAGTIKVSVEELVNGARWVVTTPTASQSGGQARVTVVEFSDIQCPACKATEPIAVELRKTAGVKFVYRHFPLITVHKNAWKGAQALEAARLLGKGWEMMGVMFDKQTEWSDLGSPEDTFAKYAVGLGLDEKAFNDKQKGDETDKLVGEDSSFGNRLKLSGTPTFFVNGEQVGSAYVLDKVKSLLK